MSYRAVELLNLPEGQTCYILDIGCGSGLSGEVLEESDHIWVGMDISPAMLEIAVERDVEGDLFLQDIGQGVGFRPGTFDGCIRFFFFLNVAFPLFNGCAMQINSLTYLKKGIILKS
jgi:18S rRNA (guanine1575-N7)-methyltransferase